MTKIYSFDFAVCYFNAEKKDVDDVVFNFEGLIRINIDTFMTKIKPLLFCG